MLEVDDGSDPAPLVGRDGELAMVREALDGARQGQSGVLVIRGEAGIGKTALLDVARGLAGDFSVSHVSGVESEMELPYAGLQQLCRPFAEGIAVLPEPLRIALDAAFGLGVGPPPDRFRVGLAVLQLLAGAAEQKPVLCVVDDAQWLDGASVQTVGFVARRMLAERMVLLIAARDASMQSELDALPELRLEGLSDLDATARARFGSGWAGRPEGRGARACGEPWEPAGAAGAPANVDRR